MKTTKVEELVNYIQRLEAENKDLKSRMKAAFSTLQHYACIVTDLKSAKGDTEKQPEPESEVKECGTCVNVNGDKLCNECDDSYSNWQPREHNYGPYQVYVDAMNAGKTVQLRVELDDWRDIFKIPQDYRDKFPFRFPPDHYRIKPDEDPYQVFIDGLKAGRIVQIIFRDGEWFDCTEVHRDVPAKNYRFKAEPKPEYIKFSIEDAPLFMNRVIRRKSDFYVTSVICAETNCITVVFPVTQFIAASYSYNDFLDLFEFVDNGTPCGKEVKR